MCRFSLGVAALALVASGAFAQGSGQPGTDREMPKTAERRVQSPGAVPVGTERNKDREKARSEDTAPDAVGPSTVRSLENAARKAENEDVSQPDPSEDAKSVRSADRSKPASQADTRRQWRRAASQPAITRIFSGPLDRSVGLLADCPPGLTKTGGCEPWGKTRGHSQATDGSPTKTISPLAFGLSGFAPGHYLYRDGYLMQLANPTNGDRGIAGYIPLLGGALAAGNIWPGSYGSGAVPAYLVDYYNLGSPGSYRYADNTLYRVDPQSGTIQTVAALLTDDAFEIGQPMPAGYDVYNVPHPLCDRYPDSAEADYRYSDGYVYRIDPATRLVTAAIDLLT
jgi:hypothetical protein